MSSVGFDTPDAAPGIRLSGARLHYEGVALFDNLSLNLPAGRTSCLLGPSGVGKSSLLALLAGLNAAAEGKIEASDGAALQGRVAWMAQQDLLLPWLNVQDNVTLGDRLRRQPPKHARRLHLLEQVGLAERADSVPAALSGGMRQRVALARTLYENQPVIFMDEPFAALDAVTRLELQDLAGGLLAGRTVLLVTHDPLEALRLGHHLLVLTGRPARISEAFAPPGMPPRAPDDPSLLALQARLLAALRRKEGA
ncbi:ABC transporter ATP-binding protein [Aquibaculum arenosum]|uniref:ABC transporter ATP-binding protein n=1 Tax=Aquibaculum arenosum TaxID=3032591 RepID=A0ABT5YIQ9_9PROT|nr:ABC transporter ATP-binding protein [Fodinicurvata sp. CAU 1616]MDF2094769.1 ABC transporter ATP-binding protein [Fodinicurvata sp. CAU 1616]